MPEPSSKPPNTPECPYCGPECPIGYGYCHCGCQRLAPLVTEWRARNRVPVGEPFEFRRGHNNRRDGRSGGRSPYEATPEELARHEAKICQFCGPECLYGFGKCHCGCGEDARLEDSHRFYRERWHILKGWPFIYASWHGMRTLTALTNEQAAEIRREYLENHISQTELARRYGVSQGMISRLLRLGSYRYAGIAPPTKEE